MIVHALYDLEAGSDLEWSYVPPTLPYNQRQARLTQQYGFVCDCRRCRMEGNNNIPWSTSPVWKRIVRFSEKPDLRQHPQRLQAFVQSLEEWLISQTEEGSTTMLVDYTRVGFAQDYMAYFNQVLTSRSANSLLLPPVSYTHLTLPTKA